MLCICWAGYTERVNMQDMTSKIRGMICFSNKCLHV